MAFGVPGTRTGFALGHPGAVNRLMREGALPGSSLVLYGHAKQDTVYLGSDTGGGIATLAVDRSQYETNNTVGATWHYEAAPANRFNVTTQWCIEAVFLANNATSGRVWTQGGTGRFRISIAAGVITVTIQAGAALVTVANLTLPGVGAGNEEFVIAWSAKPNEDTTGASNALRTELCAWNRTDGTFDKVVATHAARDSETGAAVWWAGSTAGVNQFTGSPIACRFGVRFHSATETAHDFVDELVAPTTETEADDQGLPISSTIGFAAANAFHGPAAAWACDATRRLRYRLFSALWNECMKTTVALTNSALSSATDPWIRAAPDSNDWRMHLTYLRTYPVPAGATHLWVRVHVQVYNTVTNIPVVVGLRMYSFNKHPSDPAGPALVPYFVEELIVRDDTSSGEGSYVLKRRVPISKDEDGWTYLAVVLSVDPYDQTLQDARTAVRVKAVHAVPIAIGQQGGLGFGGFED